MKIPLLSLFLVLLACNTDDKTVEFVDENIEFGAVIRTLEVINTEFDINDLNSAIQIQIEEQDKGNGALFSRLDIYAQFLDRTPDNGVNSVAEQLLEQRQPGAFTKGPAPDGFPRSMLTYSFSELLEAMALTPELVSVKDQFILRMDLHLTDGRSFTKGKAISDILAFGSFFSSPYEYTITVVDPIPADQFTGTYRISSLTDGFFGIPFLGVEEGADFTFEIRKGHSYNTRVFEAFYAIGHRGGEQPTPYEFTIAGDESIFQKHQFSSYRGKCTFRAPTILLGPDRTYAIIDPLDDSSFALQLVEGYLGFDGECGFGTHVAQVGFTKQ